MQRIILATGRCGSTLLSRCLAAHPDVLVLSEFMAGLDHFKRFAYGLVSGDELAEVLLSDHAMENLWISRGFTIDEMPTTVKRDEILMPWWRAHRLSLGVLNQLTDDVSRLADELVSWCRTQPDRELSHHYTALFDWLTARLDKAVWIERSAFSTDYLDDLHRLFPDAKYLHIHRDGLETAMSMRHHVHFKLGVSVTEKAPTDAELLAMVSCSQPESDPVIARVNNQPPVEAFGRFWSESIARLYHSLPQIPADRFTDLRFEHLVSDPEGVFEMISAYFDLPSNDRWVAEASGLINRHPKSYLTQISPDERRSLEIACRPGQILLGRHAPSVGTPLLEVEERLSRIYQSDPNLSGTAASVN